MFTLVQKEKNIVMRVTLYTQIIGVWILRNVIVVINLY